MKEVDARVAAELRRIADRIEGYQKYETNKEKLAESRAEVSAFRYAAAALERRKMKKQWSVVIGGR